MNDLLIEAHGLGKKYHRGYFARKFGWRKGSDEFWALKDIDLELRAGESLGIIGPNGAGKSTLLKILSRVTVPTEGWLRVRGRVGALIELGAGFHPELSGRDNIFIAGSILGMRRTEIARRFEEIVEFAELGEFIDMPLKKYSSGMSVRLGFAVAAFMDPDILLVDEVLAVGDGRFQKKCFAALERFREQGVPIILVSHSMYNIQRNCQQALCLMRGRVVARGEVEEVINAYQASMQQESGSGQSLAQIDAEARALSGDMQITRAELCDREGRPCREFSAGEGAMVVLGYRADGSGGDFSVRIAFMDKGGNILAVNDTQLDGCRLHTNGGDGQVRCRFPRLPFTAGEYFLQVSLFDETTRLRHDMWRGLLGQGNLRLVIKPDAKSASLEQWQGVVNVDCEWLN